jgi:protein-disulfide isomerase
MEKTGKKHEYPQGEERTDLAAAMHALKNPIWAVALAIVFAGAATAASVMYAGKLWSEGAKGGSGTAAAPAADAQPAPVQADLSSVSFDDDPVLGDKKKAKVAIIEFSDYECPFCKRFHQETFDKLAKEYVDTGKAVIVFRDFPLSFHEPMASTEASAAECVQEIAGDKAYFAFSKSVFEKTGANGKGVQGTTLEELAEKAGANRAKFQECVKADKFRDEIAKDMEDGSRAGVDGTPAFIIGKLEDGKLVDGVSLVGAQPFDAFKKAIDEKLK